MLTKTDRGIFFKYEKEIMLIEAYGEMGLRVRSTQNTKFSDEPWALIPSTGEKPVIEVSEKGGKITNGKITAEVDPYGRLSFYNQKGERILHEYYRTGKLNVDFYNEKIKDEYLFQHKPAREFSSNGANFKLRVRFDSADDEKLYGMGQNQDPYLNVKGCKYDLEQVNTQASIPFVLSNKGYGFLWNNPGVGEVHFGRNLTEWNMWATQAMDYWVCAGDTPDEIMQAYTQVTGRAPMMPDYAMGFWQCKLRYWTQEELLSVAREYKRKNIPLDVIVIDYFHWTNQGDWKFDKEYWPNPEAMVEELKAMGVKVVVSVWTTVDRYSENKKEMTEKDLLVRVDKGLPYTMDFLGTLNYADFMNPETREYVWNKCKTNYFDKGIDMFWLDAAEPEFTVKDYDLYRYNKGPALECTNIYPMYYAKTFYDGLKAEGVESPLSLIRCAWAGSQRFGALAWSGDVPSTFNQLKNQISIAMNMGISGIPWWTSDIGGFHGGDSTSDSFKQLLVRWFQFGTFCPVMRLHGDRDPHKQPMSDKVGGGMCNSGADNEVWSYGEEVEKILVSYINLREKLRPYIKSAMEEAHTKGTPVVKPLFYDFYNDAQSWNVEDQYLFGHDILVAPVYKENSFTKEVYLPKGTKWVNAYTKESFKGGQTVTVNCPIDQIPLFIKEGTEVLKVF